MSYDLFFYPPEGASITKSDLVTYFRSRPTCKVGDAQAFFSNEETGVYFSFDLEPESLEAAGDDGEPLSPPVASFNLNYFRPHVFGLEAEPEVSAFTNAFHLAVHDPQTRGMGDGPYSRDGFLRGWNAGNEFGYQSVLSAHGRGAAGHTLPAAEIERCWSWNLRRSSLQAHFGEGLFVPKIMFVHVDGTLRTAAVWPDAIPTALPDVDLCVVVRKELAPRRLFMKKQDVAAASREQVRRVVEKFPLCDGPAPYHLLGYDRPPAELTAWVRSLTPYKDKLQGIATDKILNAELVAKFAPT